MTRPGTRSTSRSTSVVLPVPDGADTMNRWPRPLLDILNLFAHLLELGLRRNDQLRHMQAVGFRAHGVDLAVHLLEQEVQLAAAGLRTIGKRHPVRHVSAEAHDL